ncbi:DUF2809 domain-containing protein [Desertivirga xinjiangensis]|uniref:ribosomal maturation YjgA family protein n=1 Tax=Desertivirga xinjiangensis TaxID=539206 RepID=UPI00210B6708|nr:DUF2809 domain-containing protein [Pedobacter xinjiangensis]
MITFKITYFILFITLFIIEIIITAFVHDDIVRPYIGDLLVVIFLYCGVRSFFNSAITRTALSVLAFSYLVETLQYLNIVQHLGLAHSTIANTIIGNYFTWIDILAYTLGILIVLVVEKQRPAAHRRKAIINS